MANKFVLAQQKQNLFNLNELKDLNIESFSKFKLEVLNKLSDIEEQLAQKNLQKQNQNQGIQQVVTTNENRQQQNSISNDKVQDNASSPSNLDHYELISNKQHALYAQIDQQFNCLFNTNDSNKHQFQQQLTKANFPKMISTHNYRNDIHIMRDQITKIEQQMYQAEMENMELGKKISDMENMQARFEQQYLGNNSFITPYKMMNPYQFDQNNNSNNGSNDMGNYQESLLASTTCKTKRHRNPARMIQRLYVCNVLGCLKEYGSEGSLNMHIKLKHPGHKQVKKGCSGLSIQQKETNQDEESNEK